MQTPRKAQKILPSSNPNSKKCISHECEKLAPIYEECFLNLIINHSEVKPDNNVYDDKVKKSQVAAWQAYRKIMIQQSKTLSSLKAHRSRILSNINESRHDNSDCQSLLVQRRDTRPIKMKNRRIKVLNHC